MVLGLAGAGSFSPVAAQPLDPVIDTEDTSQADEPARPVDQLSEEANLIVTWVSSSDDNRGMPFIVIDKIAAEVFVFNAEGQFLGATPALLGSALGDDTAPGIGDRELSEIDPDDRTTPAGRFLAAFGPSSGQRRVLWIDYDSSVALHPVITGNKKEHRLERLRSASSEDNRITFGCINISPSFYQEVVRTAFNDRGGIVYILPEDKPLEAVFPAFHISRRARLKASIGR